MNNNSGNRFFDGFLWGAIIGGGLVFLLGTKKGKKLLKTVTEEGVEGLSEILEAQMNDGLSDEEEEDSEDEEMETNSAEESTNGAVKDNSEKTMRKSIPRRFFKRPKVS
ncbi:hypothetical protein M1146_02165 [Patescibacteria group bacterium]|nr:hypothetical protein [Patescibacteria group bacterium]